VFKGDDVVVENVASTALQFEEEHRYAE